jgi:hypothetical protein
VQIERKGGQARERLMVDDALTRTNRGDTLRHATIQHQPP